MARIKKQDVIAELPRIKESLYKFTIMGGGSSGELWLEDQRDEKLLPPSGAHKNTILFIGSYGGMLDYVRGLRFGFANAHLCTTNDYARDNILIDATPEDMAKAKEWAAKF